MLKESLHAVKGGAMQACSRSSRKPETVKIIAVSKNQPPQRILELHALGISDFGENKVQEAEKKIAGMNENPPESHPKINPPQITWHFIGRLQTNKVKKAVELFEWIHSVDSLKLAQKIDLEAGKAGKSQKILLQANVSGEKTKAGFSDEELISSFPHLLALPHLNILGLMTIAPILKDFETAEKSRSHFKNLRILRDALQSKFSHPLPELSMGMSQDYCIAVEEGATMVRLGRALF